MKRFLTLLIAASAIMLMTSVVQAAQFTNASGGLKIVITTPVLTQVDDFVFDPSPQVLIQSNCGALKFNTTAAHYQAFETSGGKEYAMSYDSTKVFYRDIEPVAPATGLFTLTASDSTDFTGGANSFYY